MAERHADQAGPTTLPRLTVTRLLQNPLGQPAPPGQPGDIVRISDGTFKIYMMPAEYEAATEAHLRWLLAERPLHAGGQTPHAGDTGG